MDATSHPRRLVYITNIPSPYRVEMIEAWAQRLSPDFILKVFYTDPGDQGRGWTTRSANGVREERLPQFLKIPGYGRFNRGLLKMVRHSDVVMIGGVEQASYLISVILAYILRKPVILLFDGFSPNRIRSEPLYSRVIKFITIRLCKAYFANGTVASEYLTTYGVRPEQIFNQYLSAIIRPAGPAEGRVDKFSARKSLGLPGQKRIVAFCGYLIARKRPDLLIQAIGMLNLSQRPHLLMLGTGPLREQCETLAAAGNVEATFPGFVEGSELRRFYEAADLLVLPSDDDPWGLVVNEAMACALPAIVSDACGAARDLVQEGVNGFSFHAGDAKDLAQKLADLLSMDVEKSGEESRKIIAQWTPSHSAQSLAGCLAYVLS